MNNTKTIRSSKEKSEILVMHTISLTYLIVKIKYL